MDFGDRYLGLGCLSGRTSIVFLLETTIDRIGVNLGDRSDFAGVDLVEIDKDVLDERGRDRFFFLNDIAFFTIDKCTMFNEPKLPEENLGRY